MRSVRGATSSCSTADATRPPDPAPPTPMARIQLGLEHLLLESRWRAPLEKARYGLLLNQASVDADLSYAHLVLANRGPGQLATLFGPQHGLWSEQQDNMIETGHARDPVLDVPVFSLYSETRSPTPAMLDSLDALLVDLQDVGTRVYTYVWTLLYCLRECARAGVHVVVLDRPNPLGGEVIEGPPLDPEYRSFVGEAPIPMRHGLTIGELARYFVAHERLDVELTVVPMRGWTREMLWPRTERTWVPPSPNLPRFESAVVYPGQVLLEGTTLSEGRGTTTPFEICGAPALDPFALARQLGNGREFDGTTEAHGLILRPVRFEPTFQKHAGASCGGLFLHVRDPAAVRSYEFTVRLLALLAATHVEGFGWRPPPYEYEARNLPIDILAGGPALRSVVDAYGRAVQDFSSSAVHERPSPRAILQAEELRTTVRAKHDLDRVVAVDADAWWQEVESALLYPRA